LDAIKGWFWAGCGLNILGALFVVLAWPNAADESGSMAWVWFGIFIAQAGFLMILLAIIAYGVVLGRRATS
jgi:hypothetical protein